MNKIIFEVLNKIEESGFKAYIIGGYVRDLLMNVQSMDIDICTNALPKDIIKIFNLNCESNEYGSINFKMSNYNFDITTFREEINYLNRRPTEIKYINDLETDILRRDFTINSLCLDKNCKLIDILDGKKDLEKKVIKLIGSNEKLKEDPLRILRAIRFATILDFEIDINLSDGIFMYRELVQELSINRVKAELDKILISKNYKKGLNLLREYGLLDFVGITYNNINYVDDLSGMWAQIKTKKKFPFTKEEKNNITKIKEILALKNINKFTVYKYGLYISTVTAKILNYDADKIVEIYDSLSIKSRKDLDIEFLEIKKIINDTGFEKTKKVEDAIIENILNNNLENNYNEIVKFIKLGMII